MKTEKCYKCKRKLDIVSSLTNVCKCSNIFCNDHKIDHKCSFDKKNDYKESIAKNMPKIIPQKVVVL